MYVDYKIITISQEEIGVHVHARIYTGDYRPVEQENPDTGELETVNVYQRDECIEEPNFVLFTSATYQDVCDHLNNIVADRAQQLGYDVIYEQSKE